MEFGIWNLEFGIWNLEFGIWNLEFGIWNLEFGIWNLEFGIWNLEFGGLKQLKQIDYKLICLFMYEKTALNKLEELTAFTSA
ncbi:hypothetical protein [Psychrosphaera aestuarii]|uniref:hypothetical protein n=1 Tax=Psychrosphaera aestuarii TaxID=1266052 RepID=UPI001B3366CD|nr:hypothetical protein [Psychrosphaera aestuarii]